MLLGIILFAVVGVAVADYHYDFEDGYSYEHEKKYEGPPAPLKHDGTVDYTPEVKDARAAHFAALKAYKSSFPHGGHYNSYPEHEQEYEEHYRRKRNYGSNYDESYDGHYDGSYDDEGYHKHFEPAPLNHDGTVADTEDVKHAKAFLLKAHNEAKARAHSSFHDHQDDYPQYHSEHYDGKKYHGPPAPLNHDGTVAETPEVKEAKAHHFHLYNQALHRYKRAIRFQPAPLNTDGTVAETPEVQQAKAAFFAAHAAESALADKSWVEPKYYNEPKYNGYEGHSHHTYEAPQHHSNPHHFSAGHFVPAPLNHDGTVSDTPAIIAAKAIHFTAHQQHKLSNPSPRYSPYSEASFNPDHFPSSHKHVIPAPLNHDGTVDETPEIKAAKAVHFAAHQEAFSRAVPLKYHHPQY